MVTSSYKTRFAPSPTGPLHFGSLVAATGSYLQSRHLSGQWCVRIDDIDSTRNVPGSAQQIIETLEQFQFKIDAEISYQTNHLEAYNRALNHLINNKRVFPCGCSRKDISGNRYPGTCRDGIANGKTARSSRLRTHNKEICFDDLVQGRICEKLESSIGDFVVKRSDGLFAYQLAVVVDDALENITEIVRGADLLDSTCRQIYLQQLLNLPTPRYVHLPVVTTVSGEKLSKQTGAKAIDVSNAPQELFKALKFLGQQPPKQLEYENLDAIWRWAFENWQLKQVSARVSQNKCYLPE
jgi:glutamyl-Q tRNA(Asp) synthetase